MAKATKRAPSKKPTMRRRAQAGAALCDLTDSEHNYVTPRQAAAMVESWVTTLISEDAEIGDLVLLARSLAYSKEREDILAAVESRLMPYAFASWKVLDDMTGDRLSEWRKARA